MKHVCKLCGFVYDEQLGDPDRCVRPGTALEESYEKCPVCGAKREFFAPDETRWYRTHMDAQSAEFWCQAKYSETTRESER